MDAALLSSLKRYVDEKFISYLSKYGLKCYELNNESPIQLLPQEEKVLEVELKSVGYLINTLYFYTDNDNDEFQVSIYDKKENGFCLYKTDTVVQYSDSITLLYINKDNEKKLHLKIKNTTFSNINFNFKILGMEAIV